MPGDLHRLPRVELAVDLLGELGQLAFQPACFVLVRGTGFRGLELDEPGFEFGDRPFKS
jgi:hypothetical protein